MPTIRRRKAITWAPNDKGCHICVSHYCGRDGYPEIKIHGRSVRLLRVIYEREVGPLSPDRVVRHTCDERKCINPLHLILGTHADNVADRVLRNRSAMREKNGRAKLTEEDVRSILQSTESDSVLAARHNVSKRAISLIRSRKNWSSVAV